MHAFVTLQAQRDDALLSATVCCKAIICSLISHRKTLVTRSSLTNPPCDVITGPAIVQKDSTSTSNDIVSYTHEPHVSLSVNREGHMLTLIICTRFVSTVVLALCFTQKFSPLGIQSYRFSKIA